MENHEESFSKKMRLVTRDIHKLSDSLVNAKLAFALSDDAVWAEGLLVFYEIFKFLEQHCSEEILPKEYHRTQAFEADLCYYLGKNWMNFYTVRKEVHEYLNHLEEIHNENPTILLAYVYHLYMGLLSGGQILQKKRSVVKKISFNLSDNVNQEGFALTKFNDCKINDLKSKMRTIIDEKAKKLDKDTKQKLLIESRRVFELNNKIVRTVKGVNQVGLKKIVIFFAFISICLFVYKSIL